HTFALLIFERLDITARCQEPLLEMLSADDAEMLRLDRLAVLAHRCQELGNAGTVDLIDAEKLSQRLVRAADLFEYFALNGSPRKPAELADEFTRGALALEITVLGNVRGEIAL